MAAWHQPRKRDPEHAKRMRSQGYLDGRSGRPARWADAIYQESWRRGRESAVAGGGGGAR